MLASNRDDQLDELDIAYRDIHFLLEEDLEELEEELPPKFYYLKNSGKDVIRWQKEFGKTPRELEEVLGKHRARYYWNLFVYHMARMTNIPYVIFGAAKSHIGIKEFVKAFFPNIEVPDNVAYPVGLTLTVLSALFYMMAISPESLAISKTLKEASNNNLLKRAKDFCAEFKASPCKSLGYAINYSMLTTINFSAATTNAMGILPGLESRPYLWWAAFIPVQYFSMRFYDGFSNQEFWDGLKFLTDKNRPPVLKLIFSEGEVALGLQTLFEAFSAISLRSAANFAVAEEGIKLLGPIMPSPLLILAFSLGVYSCMLYPNTYDYYLGSHIRARKLISSSADIEASAEAIYEKEMAEGKSIFVDEFLFQKHKQEIINALTRAQHKKLEAQVKEENGCGYLYKQEPFIILPLGFYLAIGMYYGFSWGVGAALLGESLLGVPYYRAQEARVRKNLVVKKIEDGSKVGAKKDDQACRQVGVFTGTATVTVSSGLAGFTTAVGLGKEVVPPSFLGFYSVMSFLGMMNGISFGWDKVRKTFEGYCSAKKRERVTQAGLFRLRSVSSKTNDIVEKPRDSWCCFRKR